MKNLYSLRVPFRLGQRVYHARFKNDIGRDAKYITPEWTIAGYRLEEDGVLYATCFRDHGGIRTHESLSVDGLFATEEEAREYLDKKEGVL